MGVRRVPGGVAMNAFIKHCLTITFILVICSAGFLASAETVVGDLERQDQSSLLTNSSMISLLNSESPELNLSTVEGADSNELAEELDLLDRAIRGEILVEDGSLLLLACCAPECGNPQCRF